MSFHCHKPATKPLLNHKYKLKWLQWANMHKNCIKWSKVIFSNQSKFCIEFDDKGALIWRTKDKCYNLPCLKRSVKFPTSVMMWGCVSTRGIGNIVFPNQKLHIHHAVYMEVLTPPEDLPSGTPQPVPSLDKGGGLVSGRASSHTKPLPHCPHDVEA